MDDFIQGIDIININNKSINPYKFKKSLNKYLPLNKVGIGSKILMDEEDNIWFFGGEF